MPKSRFTPAYRTMLEVLVAARKAAGMTQTELGERLKRRQTFVSAFERGERRLDVIEFYAIAQALEYDSVALFADLVSQLPDEVEI